MSQDRQWFVIRCVAWVTPRPPRRRTRTLPDPVSPTSSCKFADRYNISRDEVMSQMGGSP